MLSGSDSYRNEASGSLSSLISKISALFRPSIHEFLNLFILLPGKPAQTGFQYRKAVKEQAESHPATTPCAGPLQGQGVRRPNQHKPGFNIKKQ